MKLLHKVLGVGSLSLIIALPLINQTPVRASFPQMGQILAQANQQPSLKLNLTAAKKSIVVTNGEQQEVKWSDLGDSAVVNPGDILRYTISSENPEASVAQDLTITQPIPERMVYELDTAKSQNQAEVVFSIDDGKTFTAQPTITVETEDGKTIEQPAPAETYTHVRWQFGSLDPTSDVVATYEVQVQ